MIEAIDQRLAEMGAAIHYGGTSEVYSGAKLWAQMIDGTGGGGVSGSKLPNFIPYAPSRVAEILRAVCTGLDDQGQLTVYAVYCTGLHTRELQAQSLGIKPAGLLRRLGIIHARLDAWLSNQGKAQRREALAKARAAREAALPAEQAEALAAVVDEAERSWESRMRACLIERHRRAVGSNPAAEPVAN